LKPFNEDQLNSSDYNSFISKDDLVGGSLSLNRLMNKKKAADELRKRGSVEGLPLAK
jgi:hypothetical protein